MRLSERAAEARIRRAAKRLNLQIEKSRWRLGSVDNYCWFRIVDPYRNAVEAGARFDLDIADTANWLADAAKDANLPALAASLQELAKAKIEGRAA
ncbi:MAG: hypothetical protein J2P50_11745 [Hyphomicrobiaceae bacterium]|nr:hypothetical protein [Hyphomicrobiaceae bacterium]